MQKSRILYPIPVIIILFYLQIIMGHRPRKRFGQNFLQNRAIIDSILYAFNPLPDENIIEIGPGLGALTQPLLQKVKALTVIEIDTDLQAYLMELPHTQGKLKVIPADALTVDYAKFGQHLRIIGNLPYNISTPLLIRLLEYASYVEDMHFMLQKEVVERIAAVPGTKAYGRLTIMLQYFCEVEHLFNVPAEAFYPQPKVESAIIRLTPYKNSPYSVVDPLQLQRLLAIAFAMRRKTLANNLKSLFTTAELTALGIDYTLRPEQIGIKEYVEMAKKLPPV